MTRRTDRATGPVAGDVLDACRALIDGTGGARLRVGLSGGLDSSVLLAALVEAGAGHLTALHVDHGLHPDSARWSERCEALCASLKVPLEQVRVTPAAAGVSGNLEARARAARYQAFEDALGPGDWLLLAHHADDQTESRLLHLLQGRGLYGMPAQRRLGAGRLARPLLGLHRPVLLEFARSRTLSWIEDPANLDLGFDRNYLRHQLIPDLAGRFPGLDRRLGHVSDYVAALEAQVADTGGLDRNPLPIDALPASEPRAAAVLGLWLRGCSPSVTASGPALQAFCRLLREGGQASIAAEGGSLHAHAGAVHVQATLDLQDEYPLPVPGEVRLPHGIVSCTLDDEGALHPVGAVRVTFMPALAAGGTKLRSGGRLRPVRELLRVAGVPPFARDRHPLLVDDAGVLAVAGIRARDAGVDGKERGAATLVWTPAEPG